MRKKFLWIPLMILALAVLVSGCSGTVDTGSAVDQGQTVVSELAEEVTEELSEEVSEAEPEAITEEAAEETSEAVTEEAAEETSEAVTEEATEETEYVEYTFRKQSLLDSHYEKHGIEMGFASAEEYEKAASDVVNNPAALHKTEAEDGDDVYYVEDTNEFVIVSQDGYLRTYFLPSAGKKYYDKQ